jgi:hypothetical protein
MTKIITYFFLSTLSWHIFAANDDIFCEKIIYHKYLINNLNLLFELKDRKKNCIISPFCNNRFIATHLFFSKYKTNKEHLESYSNNNLYYHSSFIPKNEDNQTVKTIFEIKFIAEFQNNCLQLTNSYFFFAANSTINSVKSLFIIFSISSLYKRDKSGWEAVRFSINDNYIIDIVLPDNKQLSPIYKQNKIILKLITSLNKLDNKHASYINIKLPLFKIDCTKDISEYLNDYILQKDTYTKKQILAKSKKNHNLIENTSINQEILLEFKSKNLLITNTAQDSPNTIRDYSKEPKFDFIVDRAFFIIISKIGKYKKNEKNSIILMAKIENPTLKH